MRAVLIMFGLMVAQSQVFADERHAADEVAIGQLTVTYQCQAATGDGAAYEWAKENAEQLVGSARMNEIAQALEANPPEMENTAAQYCLAVIEAMQSD